MRGGAPNSQTDLQPRRRAAKALIAALAGLLSPLTAQAQGAS